MGYCAAPNCKNKSSDGVRVFRFPRDKKRRAQWLQNCRRDNWQPTDSSVLCEHHFEESQYEQRRADGRKLLRWNSVPTIFNVPNPPTSLKSTRKHRKKKVFACNKGSSRNRFLKRGAVPSQNLPVSSHPSRFFVERLSKRNTLNKQPPNNTKGDRRDCVPRIGKVFSAATDIHEQEPTTERASRAASQHEEIIKAVSKKAGSVLQNTPGELAATSGTEPPQKRRRKKGPETEPVSPKHEFEVTASAQYLTGPGNVLAGPFLLVQETPDSSKPPVAFPIVASGQISTRWQHNTQKSRPADDGHENGGNRSVLIKTGPDQVEVRVEDLCRTCGCTSNDLISMFGNEASELQLLEKIHTYLPIVVTGEDLMPLGICQPCIEKLQICHNFVYGCIEADTELKKLLNLEEVSEIKQEEAEDEYTGMETGLDDQNTAHDAVGEKKDDDPALGVSGRETQNEEDRITTELKDDSPHNDDNDADQEDAVPGVAAADSIGDTEPKLLKPVGVIRKAKQITKKKAKFKVVIMKMKNIDELKPDELIEKALDELKNKPGTLDIGVISQQDNGAEELPPKASDIKIHEDLKTLVPEYTSGSANKTTATDTLNLNDFDGVHLDENDGVNPGYTKADDNGTVHLGDATVDPNMDHSYTRSTTMIHSCKYCDETYICKNLLLHHQKLEHFDKVFACPYCSVIIHESRDLYEKHLQKHLTEMENRNKSAPADKQDRIKLVGMADICLERDELTIESNLAKLKSKVSMKVSKEFEDIDSDTRTKILGTIKEMLKNTEESITEMPVQNRWECTKCKHVSDNWSAHMEHVQKHKILWYICSQCGAKYHLKSKLKKHISLAHRKPSNDSFVCEFCGKVFKQNYALRCHIMTHNLKEECKECGKMFPTCRALNKHAKTHGNSTPYLCEICGKSVKYYGSLRTHKLIHTNPDYFRRYSCTTCGKKCRTRYRLKEHMHVHTNERPYKCESCPKSFYKSDLLKQHMEVHLNRRRYKCPVCDRGFNRQDNMRAHARRHEQGGSTQSLYTCTICKQPFGNRSELLSHRRTHTSEEMNAAMKKQQKEGSEQRLFLCSICGKHLSSKLTLKYHTMRHKNELPHKCDICGKSFVSTTTLQLHKKCTHSNDKPFLCQFCFKAFRFKMNLEIHERIHTGCKPFSCKYCSLSFRARATLNQHLVVHSDVGRYTCPYCSRTFKRADGLRSHMRTHTGERPYACRIGCGKAFKQKGDCNKHELSHLKKKATVLKELWHCEACGDSFQQKNDLNAHVAAGHGVDTVEFAENVEGLGKEQEANIDLQSIDNVH